MTTLARRLSCNILVVLTAFFTLLVSRALALSWTEQTTPATDQLRDVWAADGANIWVVGNGGRIVKGDGSGNWALQTSGVPNPLIEVWGTSATNLWAVGGSGRILRSTNGTSWATQTSGTANTLFSLWGSSDTNVWAAGDQSTLTRWNGTSWTASSLGVGVNMICHGLWGTAANNIWMVGTHINTGNGMVYRYNGTSWTADTSMGTVAGLNDVWGTSASDVWAVGGGGLILRWNGTTWSTSPSGTTQDLLSIWGSSATDVYATSAEGGIFRFNGTSWTAETSGSIERMNSVFGTSASAVYVAGGSFQVATILAGAPPPPNAAPVIRNTFGGEVPATFAENLAENTPFAGTLIATDADLPAQTLTWTKDGADKDKFTLNPTTGAYALNTLNGTLDFETRTDADMNGIYEVTFTVTDSGTSPATDSVALSITVTDENDAPTVSAIGPQSTNEDTPKTIAFTVGDQDAGQSAAALVVTATVRVADRALIPQTAENIVLGGSGASRTLTLTPAADLSGTAEITVQVSDGQAEHHTTSRTFILTVNPVNDAPSFTLLVNVTRFPGSGAYTQAGVVSAISPGPADESGQTVTLSLPTITHPGLFTVQPTLAANGSLSFTPGSTPGVSTLTVRAQDDGGGVNFTEQTFTITISVLNPRLAGEVWGQLTTDNLSELAQWISITSSADGYKLAAVASNRQIYTSSDSGVTWTPRESIRNWQSITSSADGSKLAAVVGGDQIYTSTDSGATWTARDSSRNWRSITSSADGSKLAAVVGGPNNYNLGQIYTSTDSGVTWTARETDRRWKFITSSADGKKLAAVVDDGQIYTSTNSGETWTARMTDANRRGETWTPRETDRTWFSITTSADGSKLAAVVAGGQIYTSTDSGVTWAPRGLKRSWQSITSSADGSKLAALAYNDYIYTSEGSSLPDVAAGRAFTQANFTSADTSSNIVSYQVTNNNPALFAVQPAIAANGTLTFTAGQNAGTATVTVTATYNSGTNSASATFTVNVTKPLKVVESFFVVTNEVPAEQDRLIAVGETFVGIFFGSFYIDNAPSDLPPLVLSGPDAAAFDLNPTIGLEFKTVPVFPNPRLGSLGVYDVTLSIGAATSPLGIAKARLRITSNKAPTLAAIANPAELAMNAPQQTVNLSGIGAGAGESQALTVIATSSNTALIPHPTVSYSSAATTGTLTFTPVVNAAGSAVITVTVNDSQAANNLTMQTFTITVTPPPPPTLTSVAPAIGSTLGGTPVTLTGTNFAGPASVTHSSSLGRKRRSIRESPPMGNITISKVLTLNHDAAPAWASSCS
ncbi:MAG: cadherin domain-containing protein, partial [Verrucomicrobia bacterium]|nr:cadherin domain-containing protein [Verrucomicrobiota bacterium]